MVDERESFFVFEELRVYWGRSLLILEIIIEMKVNLYIVVEV